MPAVHPWLIEAAGRLARAAGVTESELELSEEETELLLRVAGRAAHESGERTNAPLLCHLLGVTHAKSGRSLAELIRAVEKDGAA